MKAVRKIRLPAGLLAVCLLLPLLLCGCSLGEERQKAPEYVFSYAENQPGDYPATQAARYFAELVKERTEGRIEIRIYPNAELGDEVSSVRQLTYGGIDFARASLSSLNAYSPMAVVLQMPYLYKDAAHMWRVLDGEIGDMVMESFDGSGIVGLSWYDAGVRCFYTRSGPIRTIRDLRGLRIRVQEGNYMEDMVRSLGAIPVPLVYSEVYSALETGQVDGAENNIPSYETMDHNLVAPYYSMDEHVRIPEMQIVSQATWNRLSEEDRQIIRECAAESSLYERQLWEENNEEARRRAELDGTVFNEVDDQEKDWMRRAMVSLYQKYCSDYMDVLDRIRAMEEEK